MLQHCVLDQHSPQVRRHVWQGEKRRMLVKQQRLIAMARRMPNSVVASSNADAMQAPKLTMDRHISRSDIHRQRLNPMYR